MPYVCPYEWKTCSWTPCKGMVDSEFFTNISLSNSLKETGCSFSNPKILSACKYANEQEFFEWPCRAGFDYLNFTYEVFTDYTIFENG